MSEPHLLEPYLALIEQERQCRPAEAMLADEIHRLRAAGQALADALQAVRRVPWEPPDATEWWDNTRRPALDAWRALVPPATTAEDTPA